MLCCTQHMMITWLSHWPAGAWRHYYMSTLSGSIFGAFVLYLRHTVQITPPTGPTSLCVFANRIVWNWTWTWTCLVLNCAERFYKVSSELGVWKKWHWEKVCTLGPVVEEICFSSFFSHFLSISADVGKCCDPENRCMWLHRQGLKPRRLLWPKKLPQKKHEFSFIHQQTVCVWCRLFEQPVAYLAACSSTPWQSSKWQTSQSIYLSARTLPSSCCFL